MLAFHIDETRCIQCGECVADCPVSVIVMDQGLPAVPVHRESLCIGCQHCLAVCPTGALSILDKDPDASQEIMPFAPDAMENLIKSRRSVRRYRKDAVAPETIQRLMHVIAHAPTGKNERKVRFTLVDDPAVMDLIRLQTIEGIRMAAAEDALPESMAFFAKFVEPFERGRDIIYRWAPHMLIASSPRTRRLPRRTRSSPCLILNSWPTALAWARSGADSPAGPCSRWSRSWGASWASPGSTDPCMS